MSSFTTISIPKQFLYVPTNLIYITRVLLNRLHIKYEFDNTTSKGNIKGHFFMQYQDKFSTRTLNGIIMVLIDANFNINEITMEEFAAVFKREDLTRRRNIGKRVIFEIEEAFKDFNIDWPK